MIPGALRICYPQCQRCRTIAEIGKNIGSRILICFTQIYPGTAEIFAVYGKAKKVPTYLLAFKLFEHLDARKRCTRRELKRRATKMYTLLSTHE